MENIAKDQKAIQWGEEYLRDNDYHLEGSVEVITRMPWSTVHRFLTTDGYIYLKQMPPPFTIEAKLMQYMSRQLHSAVPDVIALNNPLNCFLMTDAGVPLRGILKEGYDIDLTRKALSAYVTIQKGAINNINDLLSLGLPDWRLPELPNLYQDLLDKREFLITDGLEDSEINKLQALHPKFSTLCDLLSTYKIPETIEHGDFHDNNILLKDHNLSICDWGEAAISHPFFSLISFLECIKWHHNINETSDKYHEIQDTFLKEWLSFESKERLLEAFNLSRRLGPIKYAICFYRVTLCDGMDALEQYKGTVAKALQTFIQSEGDS